MRARFLAAAAASLLTAAGCDLVGPSCLGQVKTGTVTTLNGTVEAGQIIAVTVPYDLRGSQNNVEIWWDGRQTLTGPRPQFFPTLPDCTEFTPPPLAERYASRGSCTVIGGFGGSIAPEARECARNNTCQPIAGEVLLYNIIITGPGNGAPAGFSEYKLFIVGDPVQPATYSVTVTWFSGPDC